MSTTMTRFEVQIPYFSDGTPQATAINTFLDNIGSLAPFIQAPQYVYNSSSDPGTYTRLIYGLITAAQGPTALGYLNTLNSALGSNVLCTINNVTTEP